MNSTYIAADFGGGSGRIIAGYIKETSSGKTLVLDQIYRFENRVVGMMGYLYWDFPSLFADLKKGLSLAAAKYENIKSIGIDTWGVDFGLIDRLGNLIGNPICYRDIHTTGLPEAFSDINNMRKHYEVTGTQVLSINTLFRLWSMVKTHDPKLEIASNLLFMPDLFGYFLTGKIGNEYTIASTSELLNASSRQWEKDLIVNIGINPEIFGPILMPGSVRGEILKEIVEETGLKPNVKVISVGSHDTASAVYGALTVEDEKETCAFISSGTWSLLGVLTDKPVLSEDARLGNYTNEGSADGRITLLTNITGLWILQRLKEQWESSGEKLTWQQLISEAEQTNYSTIIDVDDPSFQKPYNMQESITEYCKTNGLQAPESRGDFVKCVCLSLADRYKKAIIDLNKLLPSRINKLKIFGGGANNELLNRLTEEATGIKVVKGPTEATAIGNLMIQAIANGDIKDKSEITNIIETWK